MRSDSILVAAMIASSGMTTTSVTRASMLNMIVSAIAANTASPAEVDPDVGQQDDVLDVVAEPVECLG